MILNLSLWTHHKPEFWPISEVLIHIKIDCSLKNYVDHFLGKVTCDQYKRWLPNWLQKQTVVGFVYFYLFIWEIRMMATMYHIRGKKSPTKNIENKGWIIEMEYKTWRASPKDKK